MEELEERMATVQRNADEAIQAKEDECEERLKANGRAAFNLKIKVIYHV